MFKTLADPFSGHVNVFRVFQGVVTSDSQLAVSRDGHKERLGQLLKTMQESKPSADLVAGDIGAIAKLKDVVTGDTLHADGTGGAFAAIDFPAPLMSFAITARSKGEEDKVISALRRLAEEDPMLEVHRDEQTGEMIVGGMSQVHVEVTVERMNLSRCNGAPIGLRRKPVLIFPRDAIFLGAQLVTHAHVEIVHDIPEPVMNHMILESPRPHPIAESGLFADNRGRYSCFPCRRPPPHRHPPPAPPGPPA